MCPTCPSTVDGVGAGLRALLLTAAPPPPPPPLLPPPPHDGSKSTGKSNPSTEAGNVRLTRFLPRPLVVISRNPGRASDNA